MITRIIGIFATLNVIMLLRILHNGQRIRRELSKHIESIEISRIRRNRDRR